MTIISLIVAVAENGVIGYKGKVPWHIPNDLERFKAFTLHHSVILGRTTHESILRRLKKPLPDRRNIVISRSATFDGCVMARSFEEALAFVADEEEVFVLGGEQIYQIAFPLSKRVYLTKVHAEPEGDAFFKMLQHLEGDHEWELVRCEGPFADSDASHPYSFLLYERMPQHETSES